jgi:hypothetical protein
MEYKIGDLLQLKYRSTITTTQQTYETGEAGEFYLIVSYIDKYQHPPTPGGICNDDSGYIILCQKNLYTSFWVMMEKSDHNMFFSNALQK